MLRRHALVVTLLVCIAPVAAHADAIMPPPSDCPSGSIPMSSHAGQWCEDTACQTDADCARWSQASYDTPPPRYICAQRSLCVPPGTTATGPGSVDTPRGRTTVAGRRVSGDCSRGRACDTRNVCDTAKRCVIASGVDRGQDGADTPAPATRVERAGCSATGSAVHAATGALIFVIVVALVVRLRRS